MPSGWRTRWGKHHVLAADAPELHIGCEPYVRWWADMSHEVTRMVDPTSVLVVTDTNSAFRPTDIGTPRPDDTGYRTFVRACNLTDLGDLQPVPAETYSSFKGAGGFRIYTVACHRRATVKIASYHDWGSPLLSNHHVPLLFTATQLVARLHNPAPIRYLACWGSTRAR